MVGNLRRLRKISAWTTLSIPANNKRRRREIRLCWQTVLLVLVPVLATVSRTGLRPRFRSNRLQWWTMPNRQTRLRRHRVRRSGGSSQSGAQSYCSFRCTVANVYTSWFSFGLIIVYLSLILFRICYNSSEVWLHVCAYTIFRYTVAYCRCLMPSTTQINASSPALQTQQFATFQPNLPPAVAYNFQVDLRGVL